MGIGRFIVDTAEEIIVIFSGDGAIDESKSDVEKYLERGDASHLTFKPGETPTEFVIHALDDSKERKAMTRAFGDSDANDSTRAGSFGVAHEAYALGCSEIRNVRKDGDKVKPCDLTLSGSVVREIGMHVMRISGTLGNDKEKEPGDDLGK